MQTLLAAVVPWVLAAVVAGGLGLALANRGLESSLVRARWLKFGVYLLVISTELVLAAAGWLLALALPILVFAHAELRAALAAAPALPRQPWIWPAALALGLGLVAFCRLAPAPLQLLVVLEVLVFDGFSQVSGQLLGRHRLVPRLSPAKTWEGLAGGVAACLLLAWLLRPLLALAPGPALAGGAFTAALALSGDLSASALKRRCGLKDFGQRIPGHGGVLDRFDSLLVAAAGWSLPMALGLVAPLAGG